MVMRVPRLMLIFSTSCLFGVGCQVQPPAERGGRGTEHVDEDTAALSALSEEELYNVGITTSDAGWSIAWSTDSQADATALRKLLLHRVFALPATADGDAAVGMSNLPCSSPLCGLSR